LRDFNNGGDLNVGGDFNITDNSQNEHKLLIHCTSDELLSERPFRQENIKLEKKRKLKRLLPLVGFSVIVILVAATWAQITGKSELATFILTVGSIIIGFASFKAMFEPNSFELQEQAAIKEINMLLKSRRIE
jgi:hypothetical protein